MFELTDVKTLNVKLDVKFVQESNNEELIQCFNIWINLWDDSIKIQSESQNNILYISRSTLSMTELKWFYQYQWVRESGSEEYADKKKYVLICSWKISPLMKSCK